MDSRHNTNKANAARADNPSLSKIPPVPAYNQPRSIRETAPWKASQRGLSRFWTNYKTVLITDFKSRSREEQEDLITKFCVIITIGVTILGLVLFYQFIPRLAKVFGVPAAVIIAIWAGNKVVAPVVISRMEGFLKRKEEDAGGG